MCQLFDFPLTLCPPVPWMDSHVLVVIRRSWFYSRAVRVLSHGNEAQDIFKHSQKMSEGEGAVAVTGWHATTTTTTDTDPIERWLGEFRQNDCESVERGRIKQSQLQMFGMFSSVYSRTMWSSGIIACPPPTLLGQGPKSRRSIRRLLEMDFPLRLLSCMNKTVLPY